MILYSTTSIFIFAGIKINENEITSLMIQFDTKIITALNTISHSLI